MKSFFLIPLLSLLSIFSVSFVNAGTEHNLAGWAWSDNVGWVSFNCTNDSSCATVDYGVNENGDGSLVGYAWSPTVGWIEFGGLSNFPSGSGTTAANAKVTGGNLTGWAQAVGADGNGWDGWISLSGTSPTYGVTLSGSSFAGYSWGGAVIGWLSFDAANGAGGSCGISNCQGVHISSSASLDAQSGGSSIVNNASVPYGTVATFVWTLNNLTGGSTCSLSKISTGGTAFTTVSNITSSGSSSSQGLITGPYIFNITCVSGGNTVASSSIQFTVGTQPAGFSLGANDTFNISFLPSGWSQSDIKTVPINSVGGFTGNVAVSVSQYPTMPNASTTAKYSINGGAWTATPSITVPYNGSFTIQAEVSMPLTGTYCSGNPNPCTLIFQGTSSGVSSSNKSFIIVPNSFNPQFYEY